MKTLHTSYLALCLAACSLFSFQATAQSALDFDNVDDYVTVPNASAQISGSTSISLSFWFFPTNASPGWPDFDGIVGFRNDISADFYVLQLSSSSLEGRFRNSSGTEYTITYNGGYSLNDWNHCVLTYDGTTLSLYIDGVLGSSAPASGTISSTTTPLSIGYLPFSTPNFYYRGKVDEVALWSRHISAAEASTLFSACGPDITDPDLKLYYTMNDGVAGANNTTITSISDEMGNINGILNNLALTGAFSNFSEGVAGNSFDSLTVSTCGSYVVPSGSRTLTSSGIYSDTLANMAGCDSILTIDLTIDTVDVTVSVSNDTVTAVSGFTYQWLNCSDTSIISNETNSEFIATETGNYAVIVTNGNCSDTSACVNVVIPGFSIDENVVPLARISPNPHKDEFDIQLNRVLSDVDVQIISLTGQSVFRRTYRSMDVIHIQWNQPSGVYLVRITSAEKSQVLRIVKE